MSVFPNTEGLSAVITKEHYPSYAFDLPDEVLLDLMLATKKVAKLLDAKLDDVGRTGMMFEGFGINHIHAKLFPMHGTKMESWKQINSNVDKYFDTYEGYISSHDCRRADDAVLAEVAKKIRGYLKVRCSLKISKRPTNLPPPAHAGGFGWHDHLHSRITRAFSLSSKARAHESEGVESYTPLPARSRLP